MVQGKPVATSERTKSRDYSNAEICKETINHEFFLPSRTGHTHRHYMADQQRLQTSELQFEKISQTFNVFMLEDKIQNPSKCLFLFFFGGDGVDQRSGDRFKVIVISRILRFWMRGLRLLWTISSRIPTSRRSVWRNRKLRKKIGSFVEDRSLTWSTTTSGLLALMIPFLIALIYSQLVLLLFAMMMFRNSIRDGMQFYCPWPRSHLVTSWKACTN